MIKRVKKFLGEERLISICTSNFYVLDMVFRYFKEKNKPFIVESTSNQVNPQGGYTGLTPKRFVEKVKKISKKYGISNFYIGADHAGTYPWRKEEKEIAMEKAKRLVKESIESGYFKIHLDTSYPLRGEKDLSLEEAIEREIELCIVAEEVSKNLSTKPIYVIGTDVPRPGSGENPEVTSKEELVEMVEKSKEAFIKRGLYNAWERVVGIVVQLGIEFGSNKIFDYDLNKVIPLKEGMANYPYLTLEAHSTDYQTVFSLKKMREDGVGIFKVGPALTFAYREALISLSYIEDYLFNKNKSNLREVIFRVLEDDKSFWKDYYEENTPVYSILFSFLDRVRYYYQRNEIRNSLEIMFRNFEGKEIPLPLISQYFPDQYPKIRDKILSPKIEDLIYGKIYDVLDNYYKALYGEE